ncbi:unnamed protein product [Cylicocyclus nassatus]|uniref:Uncharacterized protein n=1 Tax=Cylicocyclus nassatus TaxID=53992 RepID=A0AA36H4S3_CYLNA|nr:unnamed protein product [Cylicocyclus nassatus]
MLTRDYLDSSAGLLAGIPGTMKLEKKQMKVSVHDSYTLLDLSATSQPFPYPFGFHPTICRTVLQLELDKAEVLAYPLLGMSRKVGVLHLFQ